MCEALAFINISIQNVCHAFSMVSACGTKLVTVPFMPCRLMPLTPSLQHVYLKLTVVENWGALS